MEEELLDVGGMFKGLGSVEKLSVDVGDAVRGVVDVVSSSSYATGLDTVVTTDMGTTIGILILDEFRIVTVAEFCAYLDSGENAHMDEDYFDGEVETELIKFHYDPYRGTAIDWEHVETLVMGRNNKF